VRSRSSTSPHPTGVRFLDPPPGSVILDVGANVGAFTIAAAKLFPNVTVVAVEPVEQVFKLLEANVAANDLHNVQMFNCALLASRRPLQFQYDPLWSLGSVDSQQFYGTRLGVSVDVEPCTLADLGVFEAHFVKIDCEGCEFEVVPTMQATLFPTVVGEIHRDVAPDESTYRVTAASFRHYWVTNLPGSWEGRY